MPIGSTVVYNPGDLILHNVSSSGNTFQEVKIAAATSSIILFNANGLIGSQSLNSTTVGTASYVSSSNIVGTVTSASYASSASYALSSSLATTAGALVAANNYTVNNLTASNINIGNNNNLSIGTSNQFHNIYLQKPLVAGSNYQRLHLGTRWYWDFTDNVWTASVQPNVENPDWTAIDSLQYLSFKVGNVTGSVTSLTTSSYDSNERFRISIADVRVFNSGSDAEFRIVENDFVNNPKLTFYNATTPKWAIGVDAADSDKFKINKGALLNTTNVITINASSNVGIGTTNPSNPLSVVGAASFGTYASTTAPANGIIVSGNVGIGSSNPANKLDVAGNISCSVITASLFSGSLSGSHFGTSSWSSNSLTASNLALQTSYTITNANSIAASLEVTGPANISGTFAVLPSSGDNTASVFTVYGDSSPRVSRFTVTREGKVGVGTTNPVNKLDVAGNISCSVITASNFFGTSSWATNALTASSISTTGNAFVQGGNSFGATATIGTNDANSLVLETNNAAQLTINSGGRIGIGVGVSPAYKLNISDTHVGSSLSSSLAISTTQNQNTADSGNDTGIYNVYVVSNFTSSTLVQNQAIYNSLQINGSGSFSGSYRAARHGLLLSNTASLEANSIFANTYFTNQISQGIPNFNIPNWYLGTYIYSDLITGNSTGSIGNTYGHHISTPFSIGAGGINITNSYAVYIARQKTANVVTNGYGIYQQYTGDLNIFAGKTLIGSTTAPVNNLDVVGSVAIGATYAGTNTAPVSGLIVQGNVGIGTTNPANKLDVAGNISASVITASLFSGSLSGSVFGTSSWATNSITASYISSSNIVGTVTSASYALSSSYTTLATTANALNTSNNYTVTNLTSTGTATFATASFAGDMTIPHFDYGDISGGWVQIDELVQGATYTGYSERMIVNVYGGTYHEAGMTQYIIKARSGLGVYRSDINGGVAGHTLKIYQTGSSAATASANCYLVGIRLTSGSYYSIQGSAYETQAGKYCKWTTTTETGSGVWTDTNFTSSTFYNNSTSSWATNSLTASSLVQSNSYIITNLTVSNISASSFTGSVFGTSSVANALNSANSYQIANLTASNISASTITASNMIVNGNLTVTGSIFASLFSASNIYITSSTLVVTDNIITINALSPYQRYAGLEMYDSGSGTLSSFLWDSINNYFFVSSSDAGASRQIILGPTGEASLTANYIPLISGSNNITSSVIYQSGSNIGIGTTSPTARLQLGTLASVSTATPEAISLGGTYSIAAGSNPKLRVWTDGTDFMGLGVSGAQLDYILGSSNYSHVFYAGGSQLMVIKGTGNIGIGTTTPLSKFVVNGGTVNTSSYTTSEARIADGTLHLMKTVAGGVFESIRAMNMDTTAGTTVRVLAASTSDPFNNSNGGKVFIDAIRTSTNMDLAFSLNDVAGAAAVERVRFMGSGNVGIGSTSPVNKLDVVGNISCSAITASNFTGGTFTPTNIISSGTIIYKNAVLLDYSSSALATSQSNYVVLQNLTGSYNSAFFDYFASSASNFRAGTVIAGWSGNNITYTEYATTDVGTTNQLTMSAAISASYIQLLGNAASSLNWNIKSSGRYI